MRAVESEWANVTSANLPLTLPWVNIILMLSNTSLSLSSAPLGAHYVMMCHYWSSICFGFQSAVQIELQYSISTVTTHPAQQNSCTLTSTPATHRAQFNLQMQLNTSTLSVKSGKSGTAERTHIPKHPCQRQHKIVHIKYQIHCTA